MTKEEAVQWLEWCRDNNYLNAPTKWDVAQASKMAIEALMPDPTSSIIDDIKAEIKDDWRLNVFPNSPFARGLKHALKVIDSHMKGGQTK